MFAIKHFFSSAAEVVLRNDLAAFELSLHTARNLIGLKAQYATPLMSGRRLGLVSTEIAKKSFKSVRQLTAARGICGRVEASLVAQKAARTARRTQNRTAPCA